MQRPATGSRPFGPGRHRRGRTAHAAYPCSSASFHVPESVGCAPKGPSPSPREALGSCEARSSGFLWTRKSRITQHADHACLHSHEHSCLASSASPGRPCRAGHNQSWHQKAFAWSQWRTGSEHRGTAMRAALRLGGLLRCVGPQLASVRAGLEASTSSKVFPALSNESRWMGQVQWSGFATRRFNDDDDDLPVSDQPAKPVRRPNTKTKPKDPQRRPKKAAAEAEGRKDAKAERAKDRAARKEKIQGLLKSEGLRGSAEAADAFVER